MRNFALLLTLFTFLLACNPDSSQEGATSTTSSVDDSNLFELLSSEQTKLSFRNQITESIEFNTVTNDAIIQGAGVGIIDVNNDGLQDLIFAGNMVSDQLYLNEGDFSFKNISQGAGLDGDKTWSTGIAVVDINNDGYQDFYVCKFLFNQTDKRANKLYINNKDNTFTEKAADFGIADKGYSVMANFLDFDRDGDLDLYVCNQPPSEKKLRKKLKPTDRQYTDRLYRNEGNNTFTDITKAAGVQNNCFSLSATVSDFNEDGFPDIYVASDYEEPDLLYQNNGDGTFTNVANEALKHMSNFSMGADVADINNDGHMDLFTADMVAEDNFRNKTNMSSMAVEKFWGLVKLGYHYQFMFNSLQLNNGNGTFSEIAQLSGVSKTDWSWAALFADADQDGHKDLFVTNGILKEIRNKDYSNSLKKIVKDRKAKEGDNIKFDPLELSARAPSVKIKNRIYRNNGNLGFESKTDDWGFGKAGWSQGMAYADLDNDGDLDFVINNTNEIADIYRNDINDRGGANYLTVRAEGMSKNPSGINARVKIEYGDGQLQVSDLTPYRGYMSSCETIAHFGLGAHREVKKVSVVFSDGREWTQSNVAANQTLKAGYTSNLAMASSSQKGQTFFREKTDSPEVNYVENLFNDYSREVLIPYKMSNLGPVMAVADVNNDGNDDFYLGGAVQVSGQLYLQSDDGKFTVSPQEVFEGDKPYEDGAAEFLDVDKDGDMDLYVASGGNEYPDGTDGYQDRLYINQGGGQFLKTTAIPTMLQSTATIRPYDVDKDGDLDFFVGGRQIPGGYGRKASSLLFENTGSSLLDITETVAPEFKDLGMVTDGEWVDVDGDGQEELVVVGEWMPLTIFKFEEGKLVKTENPSLETSKGLWNSLATMDVDNDGDQDLIAGNYGLNYKYKASAANPFTLYVKDFDDNGTNDVYLGYHDESDGKVYPVRGRQCSSEQMPFVEEKFKDYNAFGRATVVDVLEGKLEGTNIEECHTFAHTIFLNDGQGRFKSKELPMMAQIAPIYDMIIHDFDGDGIKDIFCAGNFHQREVETTRSDAGVGTLLLSNGKGDFEVVAPDRTGVIANQDVRAVKLLNNKSNKPILAIANNGSPMQFYWLN